MIHLEKKGNTLVKKIDSDGNRLHTQDSAYLEEGKGHSVKKVQDFLDIPRTLTFLMEDENGQKGYFTNNEEDVSIELDGNIIFFKVRDTTINRISFLVPQDFINYVYDLE